MIVERLAGGFRRRMSALQLVWLLCARGVGVKKKSHRVFPHCRGELCVCVRGGGLDWLHKQKNPT